MSHRDLDKGTLYVCATPIGNLEDISLRVLRVLREADLIAAEDTRRTLKLLSHYEISATLTSYHEHNEVSKGRKIIEKLLSGQSVAMVSDAGLPGISDPGHELIWACNEEGINVTICPGATAGIAGLVLSGICTRRYVFEGFLPREKKERRKTLEALAREARTIVLYEAPHRLVTTLNELTKYLGDRPAAAVREITKKFEEVRRGSLTDLVCYYNDNPPRGEFVLVVEGVDVDNVASDWPDDLVEHIGIYLAAGHEEKEAMKMTAKDRGVSKSAIYSEYKLKK